MENRKERYVNPYTDFGFKKLFGSEVNKDLLISFLNCLLNGRETIWNLTYLNTEHLGTGEDDRKAVFDVYCQNERNEMFLVEMQCGEQQYFKDRSIYYATFPIREQAPKGRWNYELKAVYVIGILNFIFDDNSDKNCRHTVQLVDMESKTVFYNKLTFIYLEMPKFNKSEDELDGIFDKWLFVLRNLSRLMERPRALQERIFTRLFEAAEIAKFSKEEYVNYEESLKSYRDWDNTIDTAKMKARAEGREEGRAEGLAEGCEEGRKEQSIEIARQMKAKGVSPSAIMEFTGLSEEEISLL